MEIHCNSNLNVHLVIRCFPVIYFSTLADIFNPNWKLINNICAELATTLMPLQPQFKDKLPFLQWLGCGEFEASYVE